MAVYSYLKKVSEEKGAVYLILIDPDKLDKKRLPQFLDLCHSSDVDGLLIGGSLLFDKDVAGFIADLKRNSNLPTIIFPGDINQVAPNADALLYLALVSGRNPEHLIGKHVLAAPLIKQSGIEPISTGYMLIESGTRTTAEYMSGSNPIPANKPEIAVATALACQYFGMKYVYLEAGSGAQRHVPAEMIRAVANTCDIGIIAGGGIRTPETAGKLARAGADIIVTGNYFEDEENWPVMNQFATAVHHKKSVWV